MPVREVAKLLGLSPATAYRYARGEAQPGVAELELLRRLASSGPAKAAGAPDSTAFRFIDLFAGIGGLRLGFESIGGQCVFTSEWDRFAAQTYKANFRDDPFSHEFAGDIRPYSANPSLIPEHDVLLAGFPCQPFSIAGVSKKNALGRAHGFQCEEQGNLFFDVLNILKHHRPATFILENVKNLERHDKGRTFAVIRDRLENELGYRIDWRVISARPWVPQKRERIFIVGFREDVGFSFDGFEKHVPPQDQWPTMGDILQSHNEVDPKYTLTEHLWGYLQGYKAKHASQGNGFGFGLCGPGDVARTLSARYYKDGSEILIEQPVGRPRRLTPLECARLMGFERDGREWRIPVSDTQAYRQFGNSVVVPAVEAVARHVAPFLERALAAGADTHTPRSGTDG
ncbi:MAG: DNA (cytosine-5-)-methyltransferase [Oceanicaulis sp.]|nr:DNA (cytosine-5-)-methyltransferase [Oceanicaulis sp.]